MTACDASIRHNHEAWCLSFPKFFGNFNIEQSSASIFQFIMLCGS